jgi:hypothetical protein
MFQSLFEIFETFPLVSFDFKTEFLQKYLTKMNKNLWVLYLKHIMYDLKFSRIFD